MYNTFSDIFVMHMLIYPKTQMLILSKDKQIDMYLKSTTKHKHILVKLHI